MIKLPLKLINIFFNTKKIFRKPTSCFSYDDEVITLISWCLPNLQAFSYGGLLTGCRSLKAIG